MNTFEADKDNLRYAEYVLGLLDVDARAAVSREAQASPDAAAALAWWQDRLVPLADEVAPVIPPVHLWQGIRRRAGLVSPATASRGFWDNLALWRWVGMGATALAAGLFVYIGTRPVTAPAPAATHAVLMVATLAADDGIASWTATMDIQRAELLVVPASPRAVAAGRSTQLWLVPQGGAPVSVGVFAPGDARRFELPKALLDQLGPTAALAVSVEPQGGSPSGQPTGPVIAKGAIRAAG